MCVYVCMARRWGGGRGQKQVQAVHKSCNFALNLYSNLFWNKSNTARRPSLDGFSLQQTVDVSPPNAYLPPLSSVTK